MLGNRQMHARALDRGKRLDRAGQFTFQAALKIDLFGELADTHFLVFEQFETDQPAFGQALRGKAQAGVVDHGLWHEDGMATLAEAVRNVLLLQCGDDLAAVFFILDREQYRVSGFPRPQQGADRYRQNQGNANHADQLLA